MDEVEIADKLDLHTLKDRPWHIEPTCAISTDGLYEGFKWLTEQVFVNVARELSIIQRIKTKFFSRIHQIRKIPHFKYAELAIRNSLPNEIIDRIRCFLQDQKNELKFAVALGRYDIMKQLIPLVDSYSMDSASRRGLISLLDWWKASGLELHWSKLAMDEASRNGHVSVLEWWKKSGLKLKV